MSNFLDVLHDRPLLTDGAMGSYLFELTGRLSEPNHVYESFPADKPELISQVYFDYLQAGAQCLKTNTFGANRLKLERHGLESRVTELNEAGVQVARDAIQDFTKSRGTDAPIYLIGSVGPLNARDLPDDELRDIFREQLAALIDNQVDAILLETFTSLHQQSLAIGTIRDLASKLPVIALVSPQAAGEQDWVDAPETCGRRLIEAGANVIGVNCCAPWDAETFIDGMGELPDVKTGKVLLSAMPNAGGLQRIDNRYMSNVNPEYMGKQARTFADKSVRLIGGCCEVHPHHIKEMHNYLRSRLGGPGASISVREQAPRKQAILEPAGPDDKHANGRFSRKLFDHEFCVSVELLPPRGSSPSTLEHKIEFTRELAKSGLADALDITDGSRGIPLMPPGDFVQVARRALGWPGTADDPLEFIPHFTSRDLNIMGIQSRLTGYYHSSIHNIIFITGDPPKMSPTYPSSSAVFDVDSPAMIYYTQQCLNAGLDFGGQPLGKHDDPRMHFTIGTGFEPEALNIDREQEKLDRKIDNGADYIMTQPAFRVDPLDVLEPYRDKVRILIGVLVLTSHAQAERVAQVPGVVIPQPVLDRLSRYESKEDQAKVAAEFATEQVAWVKEQEWAGLYLMSPSSHRPVIDILRHGIGG